MSWGPFYLHRCGFYNCQRFWYGTTPNWKHCPYCYSTDIVNPDQQPAHLPPPVSAKECAHLYIWENMPGRKMHLGICGNCGGAVQVAGPRSIGSTCPNCRKAAISEVSKYSIDMLGWCRECQDYGFIRRRDGNFVCVNCSGIVSADATIVSGPQHKRAILFADFISHRKSLSKEEYGFLQELMHSGELIIVQESRGILVLYFIHTLHEIERIPRLREKTPKNSAQK